MKNYKPDLIIHIGDGKCGTTSIQESLTKHRDELGKNQRILYHPISYNHFEYICLFGVATRAENDKIFSRAKKNLQEINALASSGDYDFILFSAESFIGQDPSEIFNILEPFLYDGVKVHVIVYVRDPLDYYLSAMQQRVKGNSKIIDPVKFFRNVRKMLLSWSSNPRVTNFHLRPFIHTKLKGGSAVKDFSSVLSLICGNEISMSDCKSNLSLSSEQLVVLQDFRLDFLSEYDGKLREESNLLIRYFDDINREIGAFKTKPVLNSESVYELARRHSSYLESLRSDYPELDFIEDAAFNPYLFLGDDGVKRTGDIRNILSSYDSEIVEILKSSIPLYNAGEDFESLLENNERMLSYVGFNQKCLEIYRKFFYDCSKIKLRTQL